MRRAALSVILAVGAALTAPANPLVVLSGQGTATLLPEYVDAAGTTFSSASPTVNYPTVAANDIMVAVFSTDSTHNTTPANAPAGWAQLHEADETGASDLSATTFWKRAGGAEPGSEAWTNIFTSSESGRVIVFACRNCTTSGSPFDLSVTPETSASGTAADIGGTTTVANTLVVAIICCDPNADTRTFTWDGGITERIGLSTTPSGLASTFALIAIGEKLVTAAGAVSLGGDYDATEAKIEFLYALKP